MGGDERREAGGLYERRQRVEHMARRLRVEVAGWFVGEQDARAVGDRPRNGDALLLAPRKLGRPVRLALGEAE